MWQTTKHLNLVAIAKYSQWIHRFLAINFALAHLFKIMTNPNELVDYHSRFKSILNVLECVLLVNIYLEASQSLNFKTLRLCWSSLAKPSQRFPLVLAAATPRKRSYIHLSLKMLSFHQNCSLYTSHKYPSYPRWVSILQVFSATWKENSC